MDQENKPPSKNPHTPEAFHPEIGNGMVWETDPHFSNLRSPDPSSPLNDKLLSQQEQERIVSRWKKDIEKLIEGESTEISPPADKPRKEKKVVASTRDKPEKPEWFESIENELVLKEDPNNPFDKGSEPEQQATLEAEETPVPEGKRVRKAIKKAEKKAKKQAKEELRQSNTGLSPFTSWLKSLRGSEYVHPYEDDFALSGLSEAHQEGISETLADLLAAQGYKDKAIGMYTLLMAKFPEKSSFFAAKIEALK